MDLYTLLGIAAVVAAAWVVGAVAPALFRPVMPPCPNCGSARRVVEVVYGEPDRRMLNRAKRGLVSLGGIKVQEDAPDLHCLACNYSWLAPPPTPG